MSRRGILMPSLKQFAEWRKEGRKEAKAELERKGHAGHPVLISALLEMYTKGFITGRTLEWRKHEELASLQRSLDAPSPE